LNLTAPKLSTVALGDVSSVSKSIVACIVKTRLLQTLYVYYNV
jgi:hypothetical protein